MKHTYFDHMSQFEKEYPFYYWALRTGIEKGIIPLLFINYP